MLKRTKGKLLIALLVVTGLAGTIKSDSLTLKERKYALKEIKDTKNDVLKSVKGLSDIQLNFKSAQDPLSIKDCIYHIVLLEKNLWQIMELSMKEPANSYKPKNINPGDEQVVNMIKDHTIKIEELADFKFIPWKSLNDATNHFKSLRSDQIKYMKSTTAGMRNHVVYSPFGWIDCYQLYLVIGSISDRYIQRINKIKANPCFPEN